jgi:hypothetical protein
LALNAAMVLKLSDTYPDDATRSGQVFVNGQFGDAFAPQSLSSQAKNSHNAAPSCSMAWRMCSASARLLRLGQGGRVQALRPA